MKETLRHQKAFDYYYLLGDKRSIQKVCLKYAVSTAAVKKWSIAFNWQVRVHQKDIEIAKKLEKKVDDIIVNTKADYRRDIKSAYGIIKAIINTAIANVKDKDGNLIKKLIPKIRNVEDTKKSIESMEKLIKADLLLMGEASDRTEHKILDIDLSKLSIKEKLKLKELISRVQKNALPE